MIQIIAGGKAHKGWLAEGIAEYEKRLSKKYQIKWTFVPEERLNQTLLKWPFSTANYIILVDEHGKNVSSIEFSDKLERIWNSGANICFIIGGPYGFPLKALNRANFIWSLGREVLPHELARLVVTEQIYRAQEIERNSGYHHV
ncbi:23S rRNA (pseudouridine(1915)-N(3))-methyltransferase RlmH [Candidatus Saccharibacteria bacterium]|nr:23S rRNA (pseudouridine(1915)-N(3))-methyltransferase RlmH [Candidatus Saccharibacteria bacterium]